MPRYKAKNSATGESVSFDWTGSKPPTQDDVRRINDEQRQARLTTKEKIAKNEEQTFTERLLTSPVTGAVMKGADWLGLNQPWHPAEALSEFGEGVSQVYSGQPSEINPEENPRIAGVNKMFRGAMGTVGPPLTAAGYALAPIPTATAMVIGRGATEASQALVPESWSPESRELAGNVAGITAGGAAAGKLVKRPLIPEVLPPEVPGTSVIGPRPPAGRGPRYRGKEAVIVEEGPRQIAAPVDIPPRPSAVPAVEPPVYPIERGRATPPPPPVSPVEPSIPQYNYATPQVLPPAPEGAFVPPAPRMLEAPREPISQSTAPTIPQVEPQVPQPVVPQIPSVAPQIPQVTQVPIPEAPTASVESVGTSASPSLVPKIPKRVRSQELSVEELNRFQGRPIVKPPVVKLPAIKPPVDIARAAMERATAPVVETPPPPPPPPPPVEIKVEAPKVPEPIPEVKSPTDIVRAAMERAKKPETPPNIPDEIEVLPPQQAQALKSQNNALDLVKRRKNLTIDQMQRHLGISGEQARKYMQDFERRGLVSRKGSSYNYIKMRGEELPEPEASPAPPEQKMSPKISKLLEDIGKAEDEGDTETVKILRKRMTDEEKYEKVRNTGTKKQQGLVTEIDNVSKRIDELEESDPDSPELSGQYRRLTELENKLDYDLKPDVDKYGPRVANIRSVHAEGRLSNMSHEELSARAKEEYAVDSMSKMSPEQLADFEGKLKQERLDKEAEILEAEEAEFDNRSLSERMKNILKDQGGYINLPRAMRNLRDLLGTKGPKKGEWRKKWIKSGRETLEQEGAEVLARDIEGMRTEAEKMAGGLVADYHKNIEGMTKAEFDSFLSVIQGTGRAVNQRVATAALAENQRLTRIQQQLGGKQLNIDPITSNRTDKALLSDYYTDASRKVQEFISFGSRGKGKIPKDVKDAIDNIRRSGGDYRSAYRIAEAYFNPDKLSEGERVVWERLAGFEVMTKLGQAVISNSTQSPVNVPLVTGMKTYLTALARTIRDYGSAKDFSLRAGSILSSVTHESQISEGVAPKTISGKMLEYTGFSPVEVHNRVTASMAGAEHAVQMFKRLKKNPQDFYARRHLSYWLGLDPNLLASQSKLTWDQIQTAAHTLSDRTQFRTTPLEIPPSWKSSVTSSAVTLFKSFAFNHAMFLKKIITNEISAGNFRPLIPLMTTVPLIGTLADRLKKFASGREQPDTFWDAILGAYTSVGGVGIVSDLAARAAVGKLAEAVAGPVAADMFELIENLFRGKKAVAKQVTRNVPVIGKPLAREFFDKKK